MAQQITVWEAEDGTLHRSRSEAEAHEAEAKLIEELTHWLSNGTPQIGDEGLAKALVRDWFISRRPGR
jgi:hypothetical protein